MQLSRVFEVRCNTGICCFPRWLFLQVPSIGETGNVKSYFLVRVQPDCDHKSRFVYAAIVAPGGANDIATLRKTKWR